MSEEKHIDNEEFQIIDKKSHEIKYYFKQIFEDMEKKLGLAVDISKKDKELGILIPLVLIDGLATIKYGTSIKHSGPRYKEFLMKYGSNPWLSDESNRNY